MTTLQFSVRSERFPLVATSANSQADLVVVVVELFDGRHRGRGECTPSQRHGESIEQAIQELNNLAPLITCGLNRDSLRQALAAGAARNALDCALWDLEAKQKSVPVFTLARLAPPEPTVTAYTIPFSSPEALANQVRAASDRPVLKLKLGGPNDAARIRAARSNAPNSVLIVDANGRWTQAELGENFQVCVDNGISMIEQPLPAGKDHVLGDIQKIIPICADESVSDTSSLSSLKGKYDMVNLKLDKTGGLTEALHFHAEAKRLGFRVMIGCRTCTSLGIAPALLLARGASFVDLDGPLFIVGDRYPKLHFETSTIQPCSSDLWG